MVRRLIDLTLLVVVLVGGTLAWQSGQERSRLSQHYRRLVRMAGELTVSDPTKVYVRALDTGEPLHFAWRIFFPAGYNPHVGGSGFGYHSGSPGRQSEFIARVRLRPSDQGILEAYTHFESSSSNRSLGDKSLTDLLSGRWDKVRVEQLGAPDLAVIDTDQPAVLLRLTLPDDIQAEARTKLSPNAQQQIQPVLYELNLIPTPTVP